MRRSHQIERIQDKVAAYLRDKQPVRRDVDGKHIYQHAGGPPLPSATEILKIFNFAGGNVPADKMEEARVVGDMTHSAIDRWFKLDRLSRGSTDLVALAPPTPFGPADNRVISCLNGAKYLIERHKMEAIATEIVAIVESLGFGGTIDFFGYVDQYIERRGEDGSDASYFRSYGLTIGDWKTGIVKFEDYIQQEFYAMLIYKIFGLKVQSTLIFSLSKKGEQAQILQCPDRAKAVAFAKQILKTYSIRNDFKELVDRRRVQKVDLS